MPTQQLQLLLRNAALLDKSLTSKEGGYAARGLRQALGLRKKLTSAAVADFVKVRRRSRTCRARRRGVAAAGQATVSGQP